MDETRAVPFPLPLPLRVFLSSLPAVDGTSWDTLPSQALAEDMAQKQKKSPWNLSRADGEALLLYLV